MFLPSRLALSVSVAAMFLEVLLRRRRRENNTIDIDKKKAQVAPLVFLRHRYQELRQAVVEKHSRCHHARTRSLLSVVVGFALIVSTHRAPAIDRPKTCSKHDPASLISLA